MIPQLAGCATVTGDATSSGCSILRVQHPLGAASSGCSTLWVQYPQGAASAGCSIPKVQHPQGAALLWVSSFGVLAEGFKMPPSGFSNGRKWACHWPMCSWEVLLLKSEGAASSRHSILRKKHCFECPISKFWLRALKWPRPASQMVENGHVIGRCAHGRFCCPNLRVQHPQGAAS
jgi:hypothetical protein